MSFSHPSGSTCRRKSEITRERSTSSDPPHKQTRAVSSIIFARDLEFQCLDPSLGRLSDKLLLQIFSNLNEEDLLMVGATSRRFHRISDNVSLWERLYRRVFQYQKPLCHRKLREFEFREPSSWAIRNPWKESFHQLRFGVHVRPGFAHIYARHRGRSIRHFETLNAAIQHCNSLSSDEELLIFLHETIHRSSFIKITRPLQIIGAGSSSNFQESVIIETDPGAAIIYASDSGNAYLGYCSVKFTVPVKTTPFNTLRITTGSSPLIEYCKFSTSCPGKMHPQSSTICVQDEGTNPHFRNCLIRGSHSGGICVTDGAMGMYEDCKIINNAFVGIWVRKKANPFFQSCKIYDGQRSGLLISEYGTGYLEKCDIHTNNGSGIEVKSFANPSVIDCNIHHSAVSGIFLYENGYGQFIENRIYANQLASIWLMPKSNPTFRRNDIFAGQQAGVYFYAHARGLFEKNNIFHHRAACIHIQSFSDPVIRLNKIHSGHQTGITLMDEGRGIIEGNEIYGNERGGISVTGGSQPVVRKNRIYSSDQTGVCFFNKGYGILEENDIFNNKRCGIEISTDSDPKVIRNNIWGDQDIGVYVHDWGRGILDDNKIFLNTAAGVWIEMDSEPLLRRNEIYNGRDKGVYILNKGGGMLENNEIHHNANTGVLISSTVPPMLIRNRIHNGRGVGVEITSGALAILDSNQIFDNEFDGLCLARDVRPVMRDNLIYNNNSTVDKAIKEGICLFQISSSNSFPVHIFYRCKTCKATDHSKICFNCIRSCHRGHDVEFVYRDRFQCDCGAGFLNQKCTLRTETRDEDRRDAPVFTVPKYLDPFTSSKKR